jgi:hypothetical protein
VYDVDLLDFLFRPLNNEELAELDQLTMEETRAIDDDNDKAEIQKEWGLILNG